MSRVLVVEDNVNLALGLRHSLESDGHEVDVIHAGDAALERALAEPPDLMILDLMLPGLDGFAVLRELRAAGNLAPVLILSARGEEVDKIQGFRLGADDYVVKPVGLVELLLRVRAILRRVGAPPPPEESLHQLGDAVVDLEARTIERDGVEIDVTPLEFDLLACLIRRRGRAVDRETLLAEVWGFPEPGRVRTRTIDTHVATLRSKIERDPARPELILTVRKVGYRLAP
ncbi:MAG: response regulator transcription factor [Gemmatimonadota bacterium]|nr:response regulator transcription factor [Gemmatimonadota bacterium]